MSVTQGGTVLFTGIPFTVLEHTEHEAVSIDRGDIHLDAEDPDHMIRIKHTRGDGVDILAATDKITETKTAYIDSQGALSVAAGLASFDSLGKLACKGVDCTYPGIVTGVSASFDGEVECDHHLGEQGKVTIHRAVKSPQTDVGRPSDEHFAPVSTQP